MKTYTKEEVLQIVKSLENPLDGSGKETFQHFLGVNSELVHSLVDMSMKYVVDELEERL